ncbi:MAG: hypothetical protein JW871_05285 [Endomicrobiales bacterium]|nr:hypothetical protein [Endomicrobiales bacterium]
MFWSTIRIIGLNDSTEGGGPVLSKLQYDFLSRYEVGNNLFVVRGFGVDLSANIFMYETDDDTDPTDADAHFYIRFPFGVEHFFSSKYPNISYSLQGDFYIGVQMEATSVPDQAKISPRFGLNPGIYFRVYYK